MRKSLETQLNETLEAVDSLQEELVSVYSKMAILESTFKAETARLQRTTKTTQRLSSADVEFQLSQRDDYIEYIQMPIKAEGLFRRIKTAELKVRILERIAEQTRVRNRL
jgi:hypothetical protein